MEREGRNHFVGWSPPLPSLKAMIGLFFVLFSVGGNLRVNDEFSMQIFHSTTHENDSPLSRSVVFLIGVYKKKKKHKHHTLCGFLLSETDSPSSYHGERRRRKTVKFSFLSIRTPIINGYEATVTAPIIIIYTHTYIG